MAKMWIDTHTHLFSEEFDADRKDLVARALSAGVQHLVLPNIDVDSVPRLRQMLSDFPGVCLGAMGLHPCSVDGEWRVNLGKIEHELRTGSYVAVGEIGLDFYWDTTWRSEQVEAFCYQLQLCSSLGLSALIHARNATDEALEILESLEFRHVRSVLHAFSGTQEQLARAMALPEVYIGIGGVCTFKNGLAPEILRQLELSRTVLETDSPYLTPVPHRGKRNESAYIPIIARRLAEVRAEPLEFVETMTTQAAGRLFGQSW